MNGSSKKGRTKKVIFILGMGVLSFTAMLALSAIAVAVVNVFLNNYDFNAYTTAFLSLAAIAFVVTITVIIISYIIIQKLQTLIDSLDRVASGDFTARIDFRRGDAFGNVYKNFNKMTRELSAAKSVRDEFVHTLSHEIKTPLFSIQGFANLLIEGGLTEEEERRFLGIISEEAGRLGHLADNAMLLTKVESQEFVGERKLLKLDAQINDCIIMLERGWSKKNIDISSQMQPIRLYGDGEMLKQVWLNLLSNAVKFTPEGGEIVVELKREGGNAVVTVKDSGAGIPPEDIPHIFDKYYRSSAAGKVEGSGLGLAICKRICTISGGDISVESELGSGSTFKVVLPL